MCLPTFFRLGESIAVLGRGGAEGRRASLPIIIRGQSVALLGHITHTHTHTHTDKKERKKKKKKKQRKRKRKETPAFYGLQICVQGCQSTYKKHVRYVRRYLNDKHNDNYLQIPKSSFGLSIIRSIVNKIVLKMIIN